MESSKLAHSEAQSESVDFDPDTFVLDRGAHDEIGGVSEPMNALEESTFAEFTSLAAFNDGQQEVL